MYLKLLNMMAAKPMGEAMLLFDGESYFDLGIMATGDFEMELDALVRGTGNNYPIVGSQTYYSRQDNRFAISHAGNGNTWFATPTAWYNTKYPQANYVEQRVLFYLSKREYGINGERTSISYNAGTFDRTMLLGTTPENVASHIYSTMGFFRLTCKRDGIKVAEFIPLAKDQILETVSSTIITNLGTGHALLQYV